MANVIMEGGVEAVKRLSDWQKPGGKTVKKELVSSKRATSKYEEKLNKHEMRKDKVASYIQTPKGAVTYILNTLLQPTEELLD